MRVPLLSAPRLFPLSLRPLAHGMVVGARLLGPLVRQTAVNASRRLMSHRRVAGGESDNKQREKDEWCCPYEARSKAIAMLKVRGVGCKSLAVFCACLFLTCGVFCGHDSGMGPSPPMGRSEPSSKPSSRPTRGPPRTRKRRTPRTCVLQSQVPTQTLISSKMQPHALLYTGTCGLCPLGHWSLKKHQSYVALPRLVGFPIGFGPAAPPNHLDRISKLMKLI